MTILGIEGLVVSALSVYYQREAIMKKTQDHRTTNTTRTSTSTTRTNTNHVSNSGKTRHKENGMNLKTLYIPPQ